MHAAVPPAGEATNARSCLHAQTLHMSYSGVCSQLYATPSALDHREDAFHRVLYVFISLQARVARCMLREACCSALIGTYLDKVDSQGDQLSRTGAVKAFRCQLPRRNAFYSFDPPSKADAFPAKPAVCSVHSKP